MKRLENLKKEDFERIGREAGIAFISEKGPFRTYFNQDEAICYFRSLVKMAYRAGCLYASSDHEEGWMIHFRKHHGPNFLLKLQFSLSLNMYMNMTHMTRYMAALKPWKDYEEKYRHEKDYEDVFFVCVRRDCQGERYFRKMMQEIIETAADENIPCILDTDSVLKKDKYVHVGMRVTDHMTLSDGNEMYTLEYRNGDGHVQS